MAASDACSTGKVHGGHRQCPRRSPRFRKAGSVAARQQNPTFGTTVLGPTFFSIWNVVQTAADTTGSPSFLSTASRARSIAGISVSMVVLELGTICPTRRYGFALRQA